MVEPVSYASSSDEPGKVQEAQQEKKAESAACSSAAFTALRTHSAAYSCLSAEAFAKHVELAKKQIEETTELEREDVYASKRWQTLRKAFQDLLKRLRKEEKLCKKEGLLFFRARRVRIKGAAEVRTLLLFLQYEPLLALLRVSCKDASSSKLPSDASWFGHSVIEMPLVLPKTSSWFTYL